MTSQNNSTNIKVAKQSFIGRHWGTVSVLGIIGFYLIAEHQAHVLGALPWLILLACPFIHIFMHRGHSHHRHEQAPGEDKNE